jgi:hypothetical protein
MEIIWRASALNDLEAVREFIVQDNPRAAARVLTSIHAAVGRLGQHPGLGRAGRGASCCFCSWSDSDTWYPHAIIVMPAKAGTQGRPSTALAAPCSSQGQALGPRFRGGDGKEEFRLTIPQTLLLRADEVIE